MKKLGRTKRAFRWGKWGKMRKNEEKWGKRGIMRETSGIRELARAYQWPLSFYATAAVVCKNLLVLVRLQSLVLPHMYWSHRSDSKLSTQAVAKKICCGFKTTNDQRESKNNRYSHCTGYAHHKNYCYCNYRLKRRWWPAVRHWDRNSCPAYNCDRYCKKWPQSWL